MGWHIFLVIVLIKDVLLDPAKNLLLTGAQAVPVVGQALGFTVSALVFCLGMFLTMSIMMYWRFNGVSVFFPNFKRNVMKKMLIKGLSLLGLFLDFIPIIDILPWTTIYFYLNVKMENQDREEQKKEREDYILAINEKFGPNQFTANL